MYGAFINAVAINTCFGTRRDEMANNIKINPGRVGPRGKNLSYLYNKSIIVNVKDYRNLYNRSRGPNTSLSVILATYFYSKVPFLRLLLYASLYY